jgi:hypothetical protein
MRWFAATALKILKTEVALEVIVVVLEHIASKTENKLDDKIIKAIRSMT